MGKTQTNTDKRRNSAFNVAYYRMNLFDVIISEMARGNFSFLILVAGIAQLIVNDTEKISGFRAALFLFFKRHIKIRKKKPK